VLTSLNQSTFPGLRTEAFLELAAAAGADAVELRLGAGRESLRDAEAAAARAPLPVAAVNALMDWASPERTAPPGVLEPLLTLAAAAGAPVLVCVSPLVPPAGAGDGSRAMVAERLAGLVDACAPYGVSPALEPVGRSTTRPGHVGSIRDATTALAVAETAGAGALLALDAYNLATGGDAGGWSAVRTLPAERIGILHVVDRDAAGGRALPGDGDLDLAGFACAAAATGHRGAASVETFPTRPWPDPLSVARRAVAQLRRLLIDLEDPCPAPHS
jgi:sugar phosphate isomerase/epimerase